MVAICIAPGTNKCDSDTKGRMVIVILTGHSIPKYFCLTPFFVVPGKIRVAESAAGYSQNLYSLRQLL